MIRTLMISFVASALTTAAANAQVNGPGPSDPNDFDTVINLPDDQDSIGGSIGNSDGSPTPTTQLNVAGGGTVEGGFAADAGGEVNILGGFVSSGFDANFGSEVNIISGSVAVDFDANAGSLVSISGGSVSVSFEANTDSVVSISGGSVGAGFIARDGSEVSISGGSVGGLFQANIGSTVNITGGSVGNEFLAAGDLSISGGSIGDGLDAFAGSTVTISGGIVGADFDAFSGSIINISGGSIGDGFASNASSEVNLVGTEFSLDGDLLDSLTPYDPFTITNRGGQALAGTLSDGSGFDFVLNDSAVAGEDFFAADALLTVTLVTPGDFNLDGNVDGTDFLLWQRDPSIGDLADWQANYGDILTPGDFDQDGHVNGGDFLPWQKDPAIGDLADWQANYGPGPVSSSLAATSLPEPSTAMLMLAMLISLAGARR